MKIIFLDIDGVLNRFGGEDFVPECVAALERVLAATGAVLVISSTWRYFIHNGHFSLLGFGKLLRSHGLKRAQVIGVTRWDQGEEPRWAQIADWLREPPEPIERYCIIDDDPEAFGGRPGVRTQSYIGLTEDGASEAIQILNKEE
jgi:hypothetical protein